MVNVENIVDITGRIAKDIDIKTFNKPNGEQGQLLKNTLGISTGQETEPIWVDFVAWNSNAGYLHKYVKKGDKIRIFGSLITEKWQDQQTGQNRSKMLVKAENVKIVATKQSANQGFNQNVNTRQNNFNQQGFNQNAPQNVAPHQTQMAPSFDEIPADEIPF